MLARWPECSVTGVELRDEYLQVARQRAVLANAEDRVDWILSNAEDADVGGRRFDTCISCYIPKYVVMDRFVPRLTEWLEPGGLLALQDFSYPKQKWAQDIWHRHFDKVMELCEREYPHWLTMFRLLPDVIKESTWIDDLCEGLYEQGFEDIGVTAHTLGSASTVTARAPK